MVYVFDLDGTLSCGKHRLHLLPTPETRNVNSAWDKFNLASKDDAPIKDNIELLKHLYKHANIIILTGRSAIARDVTEEWLQENRIPHDLLIMRPQDDHRRDIEFKEENLLSIQEDFGNIIACFDDLEHVCKHIRSLGITCHQVTHYDDVTLDKTPQEKK